MRISISIAGRLGPTLFSFRLRISYSPSDYSYMGYGLPSDTSHDRLNRATADLTVKVPGFAKKVFLLSRVTSP